MSAVDPYAQLVELAESELRLAREGRMEELTALSGTWERVTAALPARPPASARAALQRAGELYEHIGSELRGRRSQMLGAQRRAARAGRTAEGYSRAARRASARVDRSV